jgi:hypothetical protein
MTSSADRLATRTAAWQSVPPGGESLARAFREALNIVQWLARVANSYVRGASAHERVLLDFRPADAALVTRSFEDGKALELRLPTLEMQFLENGTPMPHVFDPEEHSPAETEAWLLVELLHRGIERDRFSKKLPYSIPGLMSGDAEDYAPHSCRDGLAQLAGWFRNAAAVLEAAGGSGAIVCRPQDLTLSRLSKARAEIGFAPGGAGDAEPYFYKAPANGGQRTKLNASRLLGERDAMAAALNFLSAPAA